MTNIAIREERATIIVPASASCPSMASHIAAPRKIIAIKKPMICPNMLSQEAIFSILFWYFVIVTQDKNILILEFLLWCSGNKSD